jgi:hypothetical protein
LQATSAGRLIARVQTRDGLEFRFAVGRGGTAVRNQVAVKFFRLNNQAFLAISDDRW